MTGASLCAPFVRALAVSGAAISGVGGPFGIETLCASDASAARFDELQIDLGEGPSWAAVQGLSPVLVDDFPVVSRTSWPNLAEAIGDAAPQSVFAFPLSVGSLGVGVIELFSGSTRHLADSEIVDVVSLGNRAARQVLRSAMSGIAVSLGGDEESAGRYSRREVHQATGMVAAQLFIPVDDALVVMRAHAYAADRPVREIAADVVARRLDFSHE